MKSEPMRGGAMTSGHDRTETLVFAGIALAAAAALSAMSVTSERESGDASAARPPAAIAAE